MPQILRKKGKPSFEIATHDGMAKKYLEGQVHWNKVLLVDAIFTNYKKGNVAKKSDLLKAFGTSDVNECAMKIVLSVPLKKNKEERKEDAEKHKRQILTYLNKNYVDAKGRPHPIARLEGVLQQSKVRLDPNKRLQTQVDQIIRAFHGKLVFKKSVLSYKLSMSKKKAGKARKIIYSFCSVGKEIRNKDGFSWQIDIPLNDFDTFTDSLTQVTGGDYQLVKV